MVVVNASSPVKTLADLLKDMKARPGKVSWAYTGAGNSTHLTAEGVRIAAGADFRGVPYDGGSQVRTAILGGHVDAACITGGEAWKDAQAGSLRILASSLPKESPSLPGVKSLKEQGVALPVRALEVPVRAEGHARTRQGDARRGDRQGRAGPRVRQIDGRHPLGCETSCPPPSSPVSSRRTTAR